MHKHEVQTRTHLLYLVRICCFQLLNYMRSVFGWVHIWPRWPSEHGTGRFVDFNSLQEEMTTSPSAKYFYNRGQVRTGNHQRMVSVFVCHK